MLSVETSREHSSCLLYISKVLIVRMTWMNVSLPPVRMAAHVRIILTVITAPVKLATTGRIVKSVSLYILSL